MLPKKPLFDFHLVDIESAIKQSGLSWFWLTDGNYWMNIQENKLFEISQEQLSLWEKEGYSYPKTDAEKCMNYQVVRFWEDLIEILPTIVQPTPKIFHELFLKPVNKISQFADQHFDYVMELEKAHERSIKFTKWGLPFEYPDFFFDYHHLSSMHINHSPHIHFWRYQNGSEDDMYMVWDFSQKNDVGFSVWSAGKGIYKLPFTKFMQEVHDFHQRFMDAMAQRINIIKSHKSLQTLYPSDYDFSFLEKEQTERVKWIEAQFKEYPVFFDWDDMIEHHRKAKIIT